MILSKGAALASLEAHYKHAAMFWATTHYALLGSSLVFSCFCSFLSCGVWGKTGKNLYLWVVNNRQKHVNMKTLIYSAYCVMALKSASKL
jgi:hypothetical protein